MLWVIVYLGDFTEDYNPGDCLSDSSEKLFWRGKGGARPGFIKVSVEKNRQKQQQQNAKKLHSWTARSYCWPQKIDILS